MEWHIEWLIVKKIEENSLYIGVNILVKDKLDKKIDSERMWEIKEWGCMFWWLLMWGCDELDIR